MSKLNRKEKALKNLKEFLINIEICTEQITSKEALLAKQVVSEIGNAALKINGPLGNNSKAWRDTPRCIV